MGYQKQLLLELQDAQVEQEKFDWIEERWGEIEEGTPKWSDAEEKYYEYLLNKIIIRQTMNLKQKLVLQKLNHGMKSSRKQLKTQKY
jgi:hypothetical protein